MSIHVVIIAGDLESPNRGVSALTEGALRALRRCFGSALEITIVNSAGPTSYDDAALISSQLTIGKLKPRLRELAVSALKGYLIRITPDPLCGYLIRSDPILQVVASADMVIDLAEGDSFTGIYGRQRLLRHILYKLPAIALRKPVIMFPQTIGPFSSRLSKFLASLILARMNLVFTREPISTDLVRHLVRDHSKVIEASDMAFILEPSEANCPVLDEVDNFVGVNISALLMQGNRSRHQSLQWDPADYRSLVSHLVIRFVREFDRDILLVPHVLNRDGGMDDADACWQLREDLPAEVKSRVWTLEDILSASQLKYVIGRSEFFVGARMHACIAAASSYVPVVPIAYSHKFKGVFRQIGLESLVADPAKMSKEEIMMHVFRTYHNRVQVRELLKEAVPKAERGAWSVVDWIGCD